MKAKKTRLVSKSFTLKEKHIRRIVSICSIDGQQVEISALCTGGLSLYTHDVAGLLDIEHVAETEISEIKFSVLNSSALSAYITFAKNSDYPIYYSLDGEHETVLTSARKLDGVIAQLVNDDGHFYIPVVLREMIANAGLVASPIASIAMMVALSRNFRPILFISAWLVALAMFFSGKLFAVFDPVGQFEIGRGKDRIERYRQRKSLGTGLLISVVVTIVFGLLVNFFSHKLGW